MVPKSALSALFTVGIFVHFIAAQTTLNPDVSLIGNIRMFTHNNQSEEKQVEKFNLSSPGAELMISGYLNPYARADAVFAWEGDENASIEELYATFLRGLPLDMNLRAGKYRLEFGRLNPLHPHAYSFITPPLVHEEFFGAEGLNDMGIRGSFLLPTGDFFTEAMGAVIKGDVFIEEGADSADVRINPGFFGRLTSSLAVSDYGELSAGASLVTAEYDPVLRLKRRVLGIDIKYKWKPDRNTSLTVEGEALANQSEKRSGGFDTASGGYAYFDYRFRQKYNLGTMLDITQNVFDNSVNTWRITGFTGFAPVEETSLVRLTGSWTKPGETKGYWTLMTQLVFSLGPHQPHNF